MAREKSNLVLAALFLITIFSSGVFAGTYSGGTGEPNDPYLIATAEDMNEIGAEPNDWDAHFLLVADINLADYTGTQFNIIGHYEYWGHSNNKPFTGIFDGNGHTISNFTYECTNIHNIGLFVYVDDPNAEIKNLTLIDPNVNSAGNSWLVGCLVDFLRNGTISGCGIEGGSVSGNGNVGGLVGYNHGTISNCYATNEASGSYEVGGLVAANAGTISNCYVNRSVSVGNYCIGGLVGDNSGTITSCYSTSNVPGRGDVIGGLVGRNDEGSISNCYATGSVSGEYGYIGGLVGYNWLGTISNCYSTGSVSGARPPVGGLVGDNNRGNVNASFWDVSTSGRFSSDGGEGKTTAEMKTENTFTDAGWDFIDIWDIGENQTYPFLRIYPTGDINHDDIVNFYDFAILADHWLQKK